VPALATIGYEASTIDRVVGALLAAGVAQLIDVRAVPLSRKPGFSKRQLAAALGEAGIGYINLRGLGTPKSGRIAARRGDFATMRDVFAEHMRSDAAQVDLAHASAIAAKAPSCLLCFEADATHCHRLLVAEAMRPSLPGVALRHLLAAPAGSVQQVVKVKSNA